MRQKLTMTGLSAEYPVTYVVGSGDRGLGFLVQIGDYLFQSPVSYYTERHAWGMAPDFEHNLAPDFNRPVTLRCLLCHGGAPRHVKGTRNRYDQPALITVAISCDRCHGPAAAHIARPSRSNIVNPNRLAPDARDSVCEQCHLIGEASILNPGKDFDDFEVGKPLEAVLTVYVGAGTKDAPFKVVSQAEQLRRSACWRKSGGRMWCGSCHDPHVQPSNRAAYYSERCLRCHAAALPSSHGFAHTDCAGCHMLARATIDGAHTAFTDHQIRIRPVEDAASHMPATLVPWRPGSEELSERNLGIAYLGTGERNRSKDFVNKAFPLLVQAQKLSPRDPVVTAGLGLVLYLKEPLQSGSGGFRLGSPIESAKCGFQSGCGSRLVGCRRFCKSHQGPGDRGTERPVERRSVAIACGDLSRAEQRLSAKSGPRWLSLVSATKHRIPTAKAGGVFLTGDRAETL